MWPDAPDAFAPLSEVVTLKWNADGIRTAMTAIKSNEALSWAAVDLIVCSANRTPPAKKHLSSAFYPLPALGQLAGGSWTHIPRTRSRLLKIEPTKEDWTTANSHLTRARIATINSTTFPRVALSNPPRV